MIKKINAFKEKLYVVNLNLWIGPLGTELSLGRSGSGMGRDRVSFKNFVTGCQKSRDFRNGTGSERDRSLLKGGKSEEEW